MGVGSAAGQLFRDLRVVTSNHNPSGARAPGPSRTRRARLACRQQSALRRDTQRRAAATVEEPRRRPHLELYDLRVEVALELERELAQLVHADLRERRSRLGSSSTGSVLARNKLLGTDASPFTSAPALRRGASAQLCGNSGTAHPRRTRSTAGKVLPPSTRFDAATQRTRRTRAAGRRARAAGGAGSGAPAARACRWQTGTGRPA